MGFVLTTTTVWPAPPCGRLDDDLLAPADTVMSTGSHLRGDYDLAWHDPSTVHPLWTFSRHASLWRPRGSSASSRQAADIRLPPSVRRPGVFGLASRRSLSRPSGSFGPQLVLSRLRRGCWSTV